MHVEPKHLASGVAAAVLLAGFLFWQDAADGREQEVVQMEQEGQEGSPSSKAVRDSKAARYEKIRGMESQTAIEDLRNPFSPAHEKRDEVVTASVAKPVKQEPSQGKDAKNQQNGKTMGALMQASPLPQESEATPDVREADGPKTVPVLRGIVQGGAEPLVILSDGVQSRSLAIGERFLAYEVVEIGRTGVRLRGPDGEIWLTMAAFG